MSFIGMEPGWMITQLLNSTILLAWPVVGILALLDSRRRQLSETVRPLWAVLVVAIPLLGHIAFWTVAPPVVVKQSTYLGRFNRSAIRQFFGLTLPLFGEITKNAVSAPVWAASCIHLRFEPRSWQ